jgi:hypothetical protein
VAVQKHVQNVWFIPNRSSFTDNATVKTAIQTYGAVYVSFQYEPAYYNAANAAYYATTTGGNHAVAIVGWDDNFSKAKFKTQPPGNGAFIVKNSWGTAWGKNGYFYLSYYDKSLTVGASFYNADAVTNYKRIYEYDPLGWTTSLGWRNDDGSFQRTAKFANVFLASANAANIKAVGFYTPVPNSTYQISLYKNVAANNPTSGTLVKTLSGTMARSGYNTLATSAAVTGGQRFSVVVTLTTPGYNYPIPLEMPIEGYSSAANAYTGQSFLWSPDGDWDDLALFEGFEKANVSLKAYGG